MMDDDQSGQSWCPTILDSLKQTMKLVSADISQAKVETLLDHLGKKQSGGQCQ